MLYSLLAAAPAAQPQGNVFSMMLPFAAIFLIMYFLIIRPQQKKQKDLQAMIESIKVNDWVVTSGGVIGKVVAINDIKHIITLRVDEATNTKMDFQKHAVVGLINHEEK